MDRLLATIDRRVHRLLARRGVVEDLGEGSAADPWWEEAPVLAGIAGASVEGRRALGARAGAAARRCGASAHLLALAPPGRGPRHARGNGFDLHAAVVVPPRDRARLERLCRYALRPPIAADRLHLTADGQVVLDLRHRWADGTTQLVFEPVELPEWLAALTPRRRPPASFQRDPPTGSSSRAAACSVLSLLTRDARILRSRLVTRRTGQR
jgi:Putative transposase